MRITVQGSSDEALKKLLRACGRGRVQADAVARAAAKAEAAAIQDWADWAGQGAGGDYYNRLALIAKSRIASAYNQINWIDVGATLKGRETILMSTAQGVIRKLGDWGEWAEGGGPEDLVRRIEMLVRSRSHVAVGQVSDDCWHRYFRANLGASPQQVINRRFVYLIQNHVSLAVLGRIISVNKAVRSSLQNKSINMSQLTASFERTLMSLRGQALDLGLQRAVRPAKRRGHAVKNQANAAPLLPPATPAAPATAAPAPASANRVQRKKRIKASAVAAKAKPAVVKAKAVAKAKPAVLSALFHPAPFKGVSPSCGMSPAEIAEFNYTQRQGPNSPSHQEVFAEFLRRF